MRDFLAFYRSAMARFASLLVIATGFAAFSAAGELIISFN
jgi:hypothetical protein